MTNLILSILPGLIIIIYIYNKDKHEKEPYRYIFFCFIFGILSCIPAVMGTTLIEGLMGVKNPSKSMDMGIVATYAFIAVALSEELAKYLFLRLYIYRKKEFDEPMDGIVYAVIIGMGFAILENVLYVLEGGLEVALLRMFTAVPGHAAFAVIMGYYIGLAKFVPNPWQSFLLHLQGILFATIVHGLYDFLLFQNNYALLSLVAFIVLIIGILMSRKFIKLHLKNSPHQ